MSGKIYSYIIFILLIKFIPNQFARWNDDPLIINCSTSPYSLQEVESAIRFWEELDYNFIGIVDNFDCNYQFNHSIMIESAQQNSANNEMASAELWTKDGIILRTKIRTFNKQDRVLIHELGHSLGWRDFDKKNHIMNPIYEHGGWDSYGLENIWI